ncbi:MAG: UDP-N-acetylglucosamine--N-acetylmuramyl-(pentapeptide) pyrophosphoryl-undecaprenol N-acetylglucosamine transferase [Candidatus Pacebacteria bacterium]|nr:UDP-N-acetylglucosamine--N-acetylmuramyl-(pentapeptide) pyrophosphoryl-undecaprenol N-acetylglucosamine transferase [Candidatus Paceibacterota bacterium]
MKILFTGGGTGGHFYPIIAIAEQIQEITKEQKLIAPKLYYMAPNPYNAKELFDHEINFVPVSAGKLRRYFSVQNFFDLFKTGFGVISAILKIFFIFPDVIFSKGGFVSVPPLVAGRLLGIPIVMHESDSVPGRVSAWAGKFATRIALSYKEAAEYFPADKIAVTGNPVRKEITNPVSSGAYEYLNLEEGVPVLLVMGGSQGAVIINDALLDALPRLVSKYQIIHQTGKKNINDTKHTAEVVLENNPHKNRYKPFDYLNSLAMRMSAGVANLVISRGGSSLFEIAEWGIPSIIIPITDSNGNHQRKNAYNYARTGAAVVIEEANLSPEIIVSEIDRILEDNKLTAKMRAAAKAFSSPKAARTIAEEILNIALQHE